MGWEDEAVVPTVVEENDGVDDDQVLDEWDKEPEAVDTPIAKPIVQEKKAETVVAPKEVPRDLTKAEQELAVKLSDLHNTMELFGIDKETVDTRDVLGTAPPQLTVKRGLGVSSSSPSPTTASSTLEEGVQVHRVPTTVPEAEVLAKRIGGQLAQKLGPSPFFAVFSENLLRHLLNDREPVEIRKLATALADLATAKQKRSNAKKGATLAAAPKKGGKHQTALMDDDLEEEEEDYADFD